MKKAAKENKYSQKIRESPGVHNDDSGVDNCNNSKYTVDFDKLLLQLKSQNKLVEIKQPSARANMVSRSCLIHRPLEHSNF